MYRLILYLGLSLLWLWGSDVVINQNFVYQNSLNTQKVFLDSYNSLRSSDIMDRKEISPHIILSPFDNPHARLWTYMKITNNTLQTQPIYLRNLRSSIDFIDLYVYKNGILSQTFLLGFQRHLGINNHSRRLSTAEIILHPSESVEIVTSYRTIGMMYALWDIMLEDDYERVTTYEMGIIGLFIGLMLAFIIYNIFLYFTIKSHYLCYFTLMNIMFLFWIICYTGVVFLLPIDVNPLWLKHTMMTMLMLFYLFMLLFIRYFFKSYHLQNIYHKILVVMSYILLVNILLIWIWDTYFILLSDNIRYLALGVFLIVFLISFQVYKSGVKQAKFILLALSLFIGSVFIQAFLLQEYCTMHCQSFGFIYGGTLGLLILALAISREFKYLQERHETSQKLLLAQSRFTAIGQAVAHISHQWKQPLANLSSCFFLLETIKNYDEKALKYELTEMLPQINTHIDYLRDIVDNYYRFYTNDTLEKTFSIHDEMKQMFKILGLTVKSTGATCRIHINTHELITTHRSYFSQVCISIIQNAFDAFNVNKIIYPLITIDGYYKEGYCIISIRDNGGGITIAPIEKVFEQFMTTKDESEHLGLGLYMVKQIVEEKLQGNISIKNVAHGTLVELKLLSISHR